jgi:hypothetical protein
MVLFITTAVRTSYPTLCVYVCFVQTVPRKGVDINVYQHKKTLAQGMMDLALLSANANQLRYVLESGGDHPYYYPSLVMISISLILQVNAVMMSDVAD